MILMFLGKSDDANPFKYFAQEHAWLSVVFFFFFSSRRRHTRFDCDWSSDVCSSDLMVRLGRDMVEAHLADAPERFVLHARNPGRHLHVGDNVVNFGPVTGAPHIRDLEGGRRYGDLAGFRNILRLTHKLGILHWQGGIVVEPVDIPVAVRHLRTYQAHIECADIVWAARGIGGVQAQDAIAMSAIEHGCTVEELGARPTLMTVTNVNSPRRVDERSEEHTSELQSQSNLVCRLLLEKKKTIR